MTATVRFSALAMLAVLALCACRPETPPPAAPAPPVQVAPQGSADRCGLRACTARELCDDRYEGHGLDDEGQPLGNRLCVPLPDACMSAPTCDCVTGELSVTHCRADGGRVYVDNYPVPQ